MLTLFFVESDEEASPIEKIDNRRKNPTEPNVKPATGKAENVEEEDAESQSGSHPDGESDKGIVIDTQEITKKVKLKLAKNKNRNNINTRKRNIVKSKAKKEIRDTVKSF